MAKVGRDHVRKVLGMALVAELAKMTRRSCFDAFAKWKMVKTDRLHAHKPRFWV
jgi:exopolysaccharide biosynthesis predicted pyruvyltransferase EpsI